MVFRYLDSGGKLFSISDQIPPEEPQNKGEDHSFADIVVREIS